MQAWFWCPCCERTFRAQAPSVTDGPLTDVPYPRGIREPAAVDCPFDPCGASACLVMPWIAVRKWVQAAGKPALPLVPERGERHAAPPPACPQPA